MATVNAVLFTSKKYKGDVYPIMIRVQHRGNKKYFKVGDDAYNVRKDQWDKVAKELKRDKRVNKNYVEQNFHILEQVNKVQGIIKDFENEEIAWTFNLLEQKYNANVNYINFRTFTEDIVRKFEKQNKIGTADNYRNVLRFFNTWLGEKRLNKLEIADIDYSFIEKVIAYGREEVIKSNKVRPIAMIIDKTV